MSAELIITVIILALWAIHSNHKRRQEMQRAENLQRVVSTIQHIIDTDATAEAKRKAEVLARIKRVGIYQCDSSNIHLR
jgi:hypothetical protein